MTKFAVLIVALALVSGLQAAEVQLTKDVPRHSKLPLLIGQGVYEKLPGGIELIPEPTLPEYQPPVEEEVVVPVENPCELCFSYMASLIDQLTDTVAVQPHIPAGPHQIDVETEIRPLPPVELPETKPAIGISPSFPTIVQY